MSDYTVKKGSSSLTTETIRKKFKNNFDLCNFSINIARNMILGGNHATLEEILVEINEQADRLKKDLITP